MTKNVTIGEAERGRVFRSTTSHFASDCSAGRAPGRCTFDVEGKDLPARRRAWLEDEPRRHGAATKPLAIDASSRTSLHTFDTLTTFPRFRLEQTCGMTRSLQVGRDRQGLRRPNQQQGHRALPSHDHRPRRPGPRSDLRLGDDGVCRRAVGTALDHHRHEPRRAGARAHAADGREVSVLPARRLAGRRQERKPRSPARSRRSTRPTTTSGRASSTSACRTSR